jgi:hypothetical protein
MCYALALQGLGWRVAWLEGDELDACQLPVCVLNRVRTGTQLGVLVPFAAANTESDAAKQVGDDDGRFTQRISVCFPLSLSVSKHQAPPIFWHVTHALTD